MKNERLIWVLLAASAVGCMKGDDCEAVQVLGGLFGVGPQPMVDETEAGTRLWFWVDAPYPSLGAVVRGRAIYTDAATGFNLAGVESANYVTNQPLYPGVGAYVGVDPRRAVENYDRWSCRFYVYGWTSALPIGDQDVDCPVLRSSPDKPAEAASTCRAAFGKLSPRSAIRGYSDFPKCGTGGFPWAGPWPVALPYPPYLRSADDARDAFNALALKAGYPVKPSSIVARSVVDVVADQRNTPGCRDGRGPAGKAPPPQGSAPPGATQPDGSTGGDVIPPGTLPGGATSGGDHP